MKGLAFAADIRELLRERPINTKELKKRINRTGQGDGRQELLGSHHMCVASDALLALAAAELVIDPSSCREDYAVRLHQLATPCGDTRLVRPSYRPSAELEIIELTIGAIEDVVGAIRTTQSGLGRNAKLAQYQRVLDRLRRHAEQVTHLQAA